ncbi:MAG: hypothetical protein R3A52_24090 [Polyangiales bacterium]
MSAPAGTSAPPSAGELRVCPGCGVLAPQGAAHCAMCATPLGLRALQVPCPLPHRAWARLELWLVCPHCGGGAALTPASAGAPVPCATCGQPNEVDVGWWEEALNYAHAVADLAAPDPANPVASLGAWNPFADVGVARPVVDLPDERVPSSTPLRMRLGVGAPLCPRCAVPIAPHPARAGRFVSQCPRCGEREAFGLPDDLVSRVPALRAGVARQTDVRGAEAGAPWWLLFEGPSSLRAVVAEQKMRGERQAAEQAAWEAQRLREQEQREREAQLKEAEAQRQGLKAREKAERDRLARDLAQTQQALAQASQSLSEERAAHQRTADEYRAEHARWMEERAAMERSQRYAVEQAQREGWSAVEAERAARAQSEQAWQSRLHAQERAAAEADAKHRKRFKVLIALWVVFFLAVAADLSLALLK